MKKTALEKDLKVTGMTRIPFILSYAGNTKKAFGVSTARPTEISQPAPYQFKIKK